MPAGDAIEDHGLLSDCSSAALVTREGRVDWWCAPRMDAGSIFGSLLDADGGGFCSVSVAEGVAPPRRRYLDRSLVLETVLSDREGTVRILDCLVLAPHAPDAPPARLLRVLEPVDGRPRVRVRVAPRFDYGGATPWIREGDRGGWIALGGDDGLFVAGDVPLAPADGGASLAAELELTGRRRLSLRFARPEVLDGQAPVPPATEALDAALAATLASWQGWAEHVDAPAVDRDGVVRSALTLRALTVLASGAIAAAATTSLPESWEGRTWDYRASWIRDATFGVASLASLGLPAEADAFRRFVERSAAGRAAELRIAYGLGGERRLPEVKLDGRPGWRGIGPVRVGNAALGQHQSDALGELLELSWRAHERGLRPAHDVWQFLCELVERAARTWRDPDRGLWEWRGGPRHFVHSKVLCWAALDRGIRLAGALERDAPVERWRAERDACRLSVLDDGVDADGVFVQAYGHPELDAAALRIPMVGFLPFDDDRMVRTVDAVIDRLGESGLVRRYETDDGLPGREGAFLACTFWAAQVLAAQGRADRARELFERALGTRNDLGLFSEEYDPARSVALGNFPQALTHLSHIDAAVELARRSARRATPGGQSDADADAGSASSRASASSSGTRSR